MERRAAAKREGDRLDGLNRAGAGVSRRNVAEASQQAVNTTVAGMELLMLLSLMPEETKRRQKTDERTARLPPSPCSEIHSLVQVVVVVVVVVMPVISP